MAVPRGTPGSLRDGLSTLEGIALGAAVVWAVVVLAWIMFSTATRWPDAFGTITLAVVPAVLVWQTIRLGRLMRLIDGMELHQREMAGTLFGMTETDPAASASRPDGAPDARLADRLAALAEVQARSERRLTEVAGLLRGDRPAPAAVRAEPDPPARAAVRAEAQPALDFAASEMAEPPPLSLDDLIAALQFPADTEDTVGFRALRRALRDPRARQLVTSAQDALTLLSQDGLYMDDLRPVAMQPDLWRRFAAGARGPDIRAVGGVHDEDALDAVAARARRDTIFRDAIHHFLRHFDLALAGIAPAASDGELAALADTRTGRAFMLLGRVAKMFD